MKTVKFGRQLSGDILLDPHRRRISFGQTRSAGSWWYRRRGKRSAGRHQGDRSVDRRGRGASDQQERTRGDGPGRCALRGDCRRARAWGRRPYRRSRKISKPGCSPIRQTKACSPTPSRRRAKPTAPASWRSSSAPRGPRPIMSTRGKEAWCCRMNRGTPASCGNRTGNSGICETARASLFSPGFSAIPIRAGWSTFPRGGSDITGAISRRGGRRGALRELHRCRLRVCRQSPGMSTTLAACRRSPTGRCERLSYAGFSVFHDEALEPVFHAGIPVTVKNTNNPDAPGTRIVPTRTVAEDPVVGIAATGGFCSMYVSKYLMNREVGFGRRLLQIYEDEGIPFEHTPVGNRQPLRDCPGRVPEPRRRRTGGPPHSHRARSRRGFCRARAGPGDGGRRRYASHDRAGVAGDLRVLARPGQPGNDQPGIERSQHDVRGQGRQMSPPRCSRSMRSFSIRQVGFSTARRCLACHQKKRGLTYREAGVETGGAIGALQRLLYWVNQGRALPLRRQLGRQGCARIGVFRGQLSTSETSGWR